MHAEWANPPPTDITVPSSLDDSATCDRRKVPKWMIPPSRDSVIGCGFQLKAFPLCKVWRSMVVSLQNPHTSKKLFELVK